jgi:hypothetical protein
MTAIKKLADVLHILVIVFLAMNKLAFYVMLVPQLYVSYSDAH